jgi:hypothetical protein
MVDAMGVGHDVILSEVQSANLLCECMRPVHHVLGYCGSNLNGRDTAWRAVAVRSGKRR